MKKLTSILLILALFLGLFGCGNSKSSSEVQQTDAPKTTEDYLEQAVCLELYGPDGKLYGIGSGFIVMERALVTTFHEIADATVVKAYPYKGIANASFEYIMAYDKDADIAILYNDEAYPYSESFNDYQLYDESLIGQTVYTSGFPGAVGTYTTSSGIVIQALKLKDRVYYELDMVADYGFSGGPVITEDGKVLGMITGGYDDPEGMKAYAVSFDEIRLLMAQAKQEDLIKLTDFYDSMH